jgi:penicillin V acylase-like amidase (Ntn superfamily)
VDTAHGPVFGCNLDLFISGDGLVFINKRGIAKTGFAKGTTGKTAQWISKYGSVTFNLAGREWTFGGMNEAGIFWTPARMLKRPLQQTNKCA